MPRATLPVMISLCILSSAAGAQDRGTIEQLNQNFIAAFAKGDFQALAAMYTEDAYLLPPGAEMIKGRSDIQSFWSKAGAVIEDVKLTPVDVQALAPDWAREIGTFTLKTKGGQPQEMSGKYV